MVRWFTIATVLLPPLVACRGTRRQLHVRRHLHGGPPELDGPPAATSRGGGIAATQYVGIIHLGQPPQEFRVVFDSSSGQLILPGSKCDDAPCKAHRRFAPDRSKTAKQIGWADDPLTPIADDDDRDTKSLSFLGSDVSGEFMRDRLCVGDQIQLCGTLDFVALIEEADDPFAHLAFDGVLGLAPSSPDSTEFNALHTLVGSRGAGGSMFSLYLAPALAGSVNASGGELVFGGYRQDRMASDLTWAPLSSNGSWQIRVEDITVGGKSAGLCGKAGCQAAVDTGASLILAPGNILWALMDKLGIDDECSHDSPSIGFMVGDHHLELDMGDYLERDQDGCRLLLGSLSSLGKGPALVLGYPFLRKHYTVFDSARSRIGFAVANHKAESAVAKVPHGAAVVPLVGLRP